MSLDQYLKKFERLNVAKNKRRPRPHKPCMLLAVVRQAEVGLLDENKIIFSQGLKQRYEELFDCVRSKTDHANPHFPFYHLKSDGFWHHMPVNGREEVLAAMKSARSARDVDENIEYAFLDEELHEFLQDSNARAQLKDHLATFWFGSFIQNLRKIFKQDYYESDLRNESFEKIREASQEYEKPVRDAAFRRVVTEAYDYRCAASGNRLILPDGKILVQAAHIVPFSETFDDDPRNGIALTPDFHWAFDRGVIAPGPDLKWHVSKMVDERIADNRFLLELDGKDLILPKLEKFWPKEDSLVTKYSAFKKLCL